jgi:hypothetical protein
MPGYDTSTGQVVVASMDVLAVLGERRIPVGPITVELPDRYSLSFVTRWFDDRVVGTGGAPSRSAGCAGSWRARRRSGSSAVA